VLDNPFFKRIHSVPLLNKLVGHAPSIPEEEEEGQDHHHHHGSSPQQQQQPRMSVAVACASGNSTPRVVGTPLATAVDTGRHGSSSSGGSGDLGMTSRTGGSAVNTSLGGVRFADRPSGAGAHYGSGSQSEHSRLL
jgi:hypothetical protein